MGKKTVGGAWLRILDGEPKGYGNIDSETPELTVAVFKKYRNLGIGTELMHDIIDLAFNSRGYKQISLSSKNAFLPKKSLQFYMNLLCLCPFI
ncbi:MAG: GNAT family N-acetyltransferase [Prevotellaceae bacterium]|nr:GNAT family N-acetyltransferase [Prevotellaceae bacterium]